MPAIAQTISAHPSCYFQSDRSQFNFAQPPKNNPNSIYANRADVNEFKIFLHERRTEQPTLQLLGEFIGYYLDLKSPSTITVLSNVYNHWLSLGFFSGDSDGYRSLMRRTKIRFDALHLNPRKASIVLKAAIENLARFSNRLVGIAKLLVLSGHRTDSWVPRKSGSKRPIQVRDFKQQSYQVCFQTDKKARQSAMCWRCACQEGNSSWCMIHDMQILEARSCEITHAEVGDLLEHLDCSLHSFRRTWCVSIRCQKGDDWCRQNIIRISHALAWSEKSLQFWSYSEDSATYSAMDLPIIQYQFL